MSACHRMRLDVSCRGGFAWAGTRYSLDKSRIIQASIPDSAFLRPSCYTSALAKRRAHAGHPENVDEAQAAGRGRTGTGRIARRSRPSTRGAGIRARPSRSSRRAAAPGEGARDEAATLGRERTAGNGPGRRRARRSPQGLSIRHRVPRAAQEEPQRRDHRRVVDDAIARMGQKN